MGANRNITSFSLFVIGFVVIALLALVFSSSFGQNTTFFIWVLILVIGIPVGIIAWRKRSATYKDSSESYEKIENPTTSEKWLQKIWQINWITSNIKLVFAVIVLIVMMVAYFIIVIKK